MMKKVSDRSGPWDINVAHDLRPLTPASGSRSEHL